MFYSLIRLIVVLVIVQETVGTSLVCTCSKAPREAKSKKGHHYSAGRKGGVLCTPKNKKAKYYEIRRQGKTKL
jgi:hypothetical protein